MFLYNTKNIRKVINLMKKNKEININIKIKNDIEYLKMQLNYDLKNIKEEKICLNLDFDDNSYLNLEIILFLHLYFYFLKLELADKSKTLVLKNMKKIKDYIDIMGFLREIPYNENTNEEYKKRLENQFLKIEKIDFSNNQIRQMMKLIEKNIYYDSKVNREILNSIDYIFGELFDNINIHSKSKIGGFFSVQVFKRKEEIKIVVGDIGLGIIEVLKNAKMPDGTLKYTYETDEECLLNSLEKEIGIQQGNGLYLLKELIKLLKGDLKILTSNYTLTLNGKNGKLSIQKCNYIQGTLFIIKLPTKTDVTDEELDKLLSRAFEYDEVFEDDFEDFF